MTGLDTNVLVRYIMQDEPQQCVLVAALMESLDAQHPGFVCSTVIVELVWVLSACYQLTKSDQVKALETLLQAKELIIENSEIIWRAVRIFASSNADFADCLIERANAAAGCTQTMTFDKGAAKNCGMTLIQ